MGKSCNALVSIHAGEPLTGVCEVCGTGPCTEFPKMETRSVTRPLRTLVLSPFAGDYVRNKAYAQAAMVDSLRRGEAPFLSHLLYPQVLIDGIPAERVLGLRCENSWAQTAEFIVAYVDLGWSPGMEGVWCSPDFDKIPRDDRMIGSPWS